MEVPCQMVKYLHGLEQYQWLSHKPQEELHLVDLAQLLLLVIWQQCNISSNLSPIGRGSIKHITGYMPLMERSSYVMNLIATYHHSLLQSVLQCGFYVLHDLYRLSPEVIVWLHMG